MRRWIKKQYILIGIAVLFAAWFAWVSVVPRLSLIGKTTEHKVFIAFGFHANLYHSYRIDTNDEAGFGKDIRIMRRIIEVLDEYNKKGVGVRAVWDIENLFSLEHVLPRYAPDIIDNIKRRVKDGRDEVIVMSYNNALASALTEREFEDSITRAISNPQGSGVMDVFGKFSPIVRPQEMMVTAGNFSLYRKHGIEAISLYYSAITFDSLRVFLRPLSLKEAFNPLKYLDPVTGESIRVMPTYNIGDLIENRSLRRWAKELHREQVRGNIDSDVLIFINFDADDPYWYGYTLPSHLSWLPNTGGLHQLIAGIADLEYVHFSTLSEYLKTHDDVGTIYFGQDTADGNFNGYNSWAEKMTSHHHWSAVMRARRAEEVVEKTYTRFGKPLPPIQRTRLKESYEERLRLLSTTNFGMAAPYLARAREQVVEGIMHRMLVPAEKALKEASTILENEARKYTPHASPQGGVFLDSIYIMNTGKEAAPLPALTLAFASKQLLKQGTALLLAGKDGTSIPGCVVEGIAGKRRNSVKAVFATRGIIGDGMYSLYSMTRKPESKKTKANGREITNGIITLKFNESGLVEELSMNGIRRLEPGSLAPRIHYKNSSVDRIITPESASIQILADGSGGIASVVWEGAIPLPPTVKGVPGKFRYHCTLAEGLPYLFVRGAIQYPETERKDLMSPDQAQLIRRLDRGWYEAAPLELFLSQRADRETPFKVLKRNFLGIESSYLLDYFRHSDKNRNLDCVNNHITSSYAAVAGKTGGAAVAMDNTVLSNFAFCPLKMEYHRFGGEFSIRMNPFGTYFGRQYYQPTWSNGQGYEAAILSGQQYFSSAPTFNGASHEFSVMIAFFDGRDIPEAVRRDLVGFSNPPFIATGGRLRLEKLVEPLFRELAPPAGLVGAYEKGKVYLHWEKAHGGAISYHVYGSDEKGILVKLASRKDTSFVMDPAPRKESISFAVTSAGLNGKESARSETITVRLKEADKVQRGVALPLWLQLKILLSGLLAYID